LKDAESEMDNLRPAHKLIFLGNYVIYEDFIVFVQLIHCKNYGVKRIGDRRCIINSVNNFYQSKKA
jgi:hypothetical protein